MIHVPAVVSTSSPSTTPTYEASVTNTIAAWLGTAKAGVEVLVHDALEAQFG